MAKSFTGCFVLTTLIVTSFSACQLSYILSCHLSLLMFVIMFKVAGLVRFVKGWHTVNDYLKVLLRAIRLPILAFIFLLVVFVQIVIVMKAFEYNDIYRERAL